jgi:hypothetical protein
MYGGTAYALLGAPGISNLSYSNQQSPPGFPNWADLWTVLVESSATPAINNPPALTWVNPSMSIVVPIGSWELAYRAHIRTQYSSGQGEMTIGATLSTNTTAESDHRLTSGAHQGNNANSANKFGADLMSSKIITIGAKTQYNLLLKAFDTNCMFIKVDGVTLGSIVLEARSAYL